MSIWNGCVVTDRTAEIRQSDKLLAVRLGRTPDVCTHGVSVFTHTLGAGIQQPVLPRTVLFIPMQANLRFFSICTIRTTLSLFEQRFIAVQVWTCL